MNRNALAFYAAVAAIVVATVGPAVYLGHAQNVQAAMIKQAADRLALIPDHFGPWSLREEQSLSDSTLKLLGCSDFVCRNYVHNETGESVALVVLVGPSGPLAVHTPEICMTSREYENIKPSQRVSIAANGVQQEFFATAFRARTLEGQKLDVYYGWSRDGEKWEAPSSPRITLGPLPMVFKLQVACSEPVVPSEGPTAGESFLAALLPALSVPKKAAAAK